LPTPCPAHLVAVVLPISGWLASVLGRKRFYMGCVALFTISSLLCGLPHADMIDRLSCVAGGGWRKPPTERTVDPLHTFPPEKLGMVFALYGVAVVVAILFGTMQLLPQIVQSLLGYTATIAGLVIPGGFVVTPRSSFQEVLGDCAIAAGHAHVPKPVSSAAPVVMTAGQA
jgi:MFS family permease